ncbi:MAG: hypothetical protein AAF602_00950 [Myxococcota bacterium]
MVGRVGGCIAADATGHVDVLGSGIPRFPKTEHPGLRAARRRLTELYRTWSPTCIAYEMVRRHTGSVGTTKKRGTDNGNATKAAVVAAAQPFVDQPHPTRRRGRHALDCRLPGRRGRCLEAGVLAVTLQPLPALVLLLITRVLEHLTPRPKEPHVPCLG